MKTAPTLTGSGTGIEAGRRTRRPCDEHRKINWGTPPDRDKPKGTVHPGPPVWQWKFFIVVDLEFAGTWQRDFFFFLLSFEYILFFFFFLYFLSMNKRLESVWGKGIGEA